MILNDWWELSKVGENADSGVSLNRDLTLGEQLELAHSLLSFLWLHGVTEGETGAGSQPAVSFPHRAARVSHGLIRKCGD